MKKANLSLFLILILSYRLFAQQEEKKAVPKPRIVVLTDVSTWETDDSESLVRLMAHADLFEIEALIFTTGWSLDKTRADFMDLIHLAIDAYEKDLPNLQKRSNQQKFNSDESRQTIGYWPSPDYLRSVTMFGSENRGLKFLGEGNESAGSDYIIQLADEKDDRPLWITIWGGGNTLAQAIWDVKQTRSEAELKDFLHKIPTYAITDQDRDQKTRYDISSHYWMRKEFSEDLLFIWDESAWKFQNGTGKRNWEAYAEHIQGHGALGAVYPKYKYGVEGDTPAFLYLLPNGLSNPLIPSQVSWGGYTLFQLTEDNVTSSYSNFNSPAVEISGKYLEHFYPATFNNFAARMDWAKEGIGNRNPYVVLNEKEGIEIIEQEVKPGEEISWDASRSYDPEGDALTFVWWTIPEAGSYKGEVAIEGKDLSKASLKVPADFSGKTLHIICEATDTGSPKLTSYRRIIIEGK
uniref:nucleoside hydrolase-like domain-containing protein n=2 Tax=Algoriphagus sp. TaxID=1872435 RepID=UPI0040476063